MGRTSGATAEKSWRYLTLAPSVLVFLLLTALPVVGLFAMSLTYVTWVSGRAHWSWAGLAHFRELATDGLFRVGVGNTLLFAVAAVSVEMLLGFGLALVTSQARSGQMAYRTVFLLPVLVPGIVIGAMWKLMYNFDFGIINQALEPLGLPAQDWLGGRATALPAVILVDIWHWTPFCFLLLLAGLQSLPTDVYEAARIDGANWWQGLRHITIPLMIPTILVTLMFRVIVAFKVFDEVYLLTGGGPGTATEVVSFSIYRRFFTQDRAGYGSAMSVVVLFALALAVILAMGIAKRRNAAA
jgi:multiple sugar transport system permease protein